MEERTRKRWMIPLGAALLLGLLVLLSSAGRSPVQAGAPSGDPEAPGPAIRLEGSIRIPGKTDASGVQVAVEGTELTVAVSGDGSFFLEGMPAGPAVLAISGPFLLPTRVLVELPEPGVWRLEEVSMRPGDLNEDGTVDILDLTILATAFRANAGGDRFDPRADLNEDGTVDILDLTILAGSFRQGEILLARDATPLLPVSLAEIGGVGVPEPGGIPVSAVTETPEYTGTVAWVPDGAPFGPGTVYTATIVLTPRDGYTLHGVPEDFFVVPGAHAAFHPAGSGVVTAVFPETGYILQDLGARGTLSASPAHVYSIDDNTDLGIWTLSVARERLPGSLAGEETLSLRIGETEHLLEENLFQSQYLTGNIRDTHTVEQIGNGILRRSP